MRSCSSAISVHKVCIPRQTFKHDTANLAGLHAASPCSLRHGMAMPPSLQCQARVTCCIRASSTCDRNRLQLQPYYKLCTLCWQQQGHVIACMHMHVQAVPALTACPCISFYASPLYYTTHVTTTCHNCPPRTPCCAVPTLCWPAHAALLLQCMLQNLSLTYM
jgi:hypothetical protein